jgi:hypothetical protein
MLHLISGKWIYRDNELHFRVRFLANGKLCTALAVSPLSHDVNRALKVRAA